MFILTGEVNSSYVDIINGMPWTVDVTVSNGTGETNLTWSDINNQSEKCNFLNKYNL